MAVDDKNTMLAMFQAATGIENIEDAFSSLEEVNWDLDRALEVFSPNTPSNAAPSNSQPPAILPRSRSPQEMGATPINSNFYSASYPVEVTVTYEGNLQRFNVYSTKIISDFKTEVCVRFNIPSTHLELSNWGISVNDDMTLDDACSASAFPSLALVAEKRSDGSRVVCLLITSPAGADEITFPVSSSIMELKQHVAEMTGILVKDQSWSGLPPGASDLTVIRNAGFKNPVHPLAVISNKTASKQENPVPTAKRDADLSREPVNNQMSTQSSADVYSDYSDSEPEIDLIEDEPDDTPQDNFRAPMIPEHCTDQSQALAQFSENFERRYGPTHPIFFCGSMQEVIGQSTKGELSDRRPVAVYLHHDMSISSNIFCQRILCSVEVASYLSANYLTWAWDMTMPTNTTRFLDNISLNFGEEVRGQLSAIGPSNFPLLLIFQKKPGSQLEIATMITIDTPQSEALSLLAAGFEQHLAFIDELRGAEEARLDRERIKEEQDDAYQATTETDRRIMQEREQQHKLRIRSEEAKLRMKAMEEDSRQFAARKVPDEPDKGPGTTTIRFRFPPGDTLSRRFLASDRLGLLFTFAHAKGYPPDRHRLILNFPKKDLRDVPSDTNLKECGLTPQALVFVEEDFEDS